MNAVEQIDTIVTQSLKSLADDLHGTSWTGRREREVVSLFCSGHLLHHCRAGTVLSDPTQISIEVAVPQIPGQRDLTSKASSKSQVCKDIVIWRTPGATCWDEKGKPTVRPLSVIEWKHNVGPGSRYDVTWLREFSSQAPDFVGYAVSTNRSARGFSLSCARVFRGAQAERWLYLG